MIQRLALMVLLVVVGFSRADSPERTELLKMADALRPAPADFAWQLIPWHIEPTSALKEAKDEQRPLLVWLAGGRDRDGSPLERC